MSSRIVLEKQFLLKVIIFFMTYEVNGQGILNGSLYVCVPPGICLGGIDPRIITPDARMQDSGNLQNLIDEVFYNKILTDGAPTPGVATCAAGTIPCYAQGSMSKCGLRGDNKKEADGMADIDAYPWLAYLTGPNDVYLGVGSLLTPYHVLTAAHKVLAYKNNPAQLKIYFGVSNPANLLATPKLNSTASVIYTHPLHNNDTLKNDIAVVKLLNPISLLDTTKVNTICLPPATDTNTTYTNPPRTCIVSGWGQIQPNNTAVPTQLKQVNVNTTDGDTCEKGFSGKVDTSLYLDKVGEICAGGEPQKDACYQDGGAPLNCKTGSTYTVAGIVIWGKSCGQPGVYGVYTNVPTYRQWVQAQLLCPNTTACAA